MVDPLDADLVEALPDVGDRIFLVDVAVHRQAEALVTGPREDVAELDGRVAALVGVEADADDPVLVGEGLLERRERGVGRQVAQEAHDQAVAQAERGLGVELRAAEALDHGGEGDAAARVRLRVEEHLRVDHVLRRGLAEVGGRRGRRSPARGRRTLMPS